MNSNDWCIENWGTRWDAVNTERWENDETLVYIFSTAESPPIKVVKKMSEMFQDLRFELKYYESGVGFKGIFGCEKGEVKIDMKSKFVIDE